MRLFSVEDIAMVFGAAGMSPDETTEAFVTQRFGLDGESVYAVLMSSLREQAVDEAESIPEAFALDPVGAAALCGVQVGLTAAVALLEARAFQALMEGRL